MAEWVDQLADYSATTRADKFRLTPEKYWQIKSVDKWITMPDHYKTGLVLVGAGGIGYFKSNSLLWKVI